jgi:hypothetical protein
MRKFIKIAFLSVFCFVLEAIAFGVSIMQPSNPSTWIGIKQLTFMAGLIVVFAWMATLLKILNHGRKFRHQTAFVVCCMVALAHYGALRSTTNLTLSRFFQSGSTCTSLVSHSLENGCYLDLVKTEFKKKNHDEQSFYLIKVANIFKEAKRYNSTTLPLLMGVEITGQATYKKTLQTDEEKSYVSIDLVSDMIVLIELLDTKGATQEDQKTVSRFLAMGQKNLHEASEHFPLRVPASIQPFSQQEKILELTRHFETIKSTWNLSNEEITSTEK